MSRKKNEDIAVDQAQESTETNNEEIGLADDAEIISESENSENEDAERSSSDNDSSVEGETEESSNEPLKVSLRGVTLKTDKASQKVGTHSVFIGRQIVTFTDGKAELPIELANAVISAGYAE